ncbi:hypothetical protein KY285_007785 [Solanum tuberosum]|nr:hypothetical protein KY289_008138 [Solanum tuberosum]KAH0746128.1 hypothetical protein KY285_007785 [Solanum tuberosum]
MEFPATGQSPQVTSQFSITSPDQFPHIRVPQNDKQTKAVKSAINNAEENNPKFDKRKTLEPIAITSVSFINGIPRVTWTEEEVEKLNIMENLQLAVVGKFSYGWPELEELRIQMSDWALEE